MLGQLGNKLPLVGNQQPQRRGLTHDFAWANAKDGVIIVTWGNAHYHDFVSSWIASLRAVGVTNMVVGALDGTLYDRLERVGIPTFFIASGLTRSDFGWGSRSFHLMGRQKVTLLRDFTNMGLSVLLTDVDTTWMRNPLPYFASFTNADLLVSSDTLTTTSFDGSLEVPRKARGAFNIGIIYAKPSARPMVDDWLRELQENLRLWDQAIFNRILRRGTESGSALPDNTVRSSGQTWSVRFGILPVGYFCSGHTFFVQHMPNTLKASAYVAHATFQFSGTPGKRHRFREAQLWNDETSYYANPGKLLTISEPIPEWIWANSNDSIAGHFRLVNFQLRQIRSAMGLAIALNRTLVLPQLWCGFDRWWAPHRGRIPGSAFSLPFRCPLDHVFSVNILTSNLNPIHYGPNIRVREHSFLDNPRTPREVKESRVIVDFDGIRHQDDRDSQRVMLQSGLSDYDARSQLRKYDSAQVIELTTAENVFSGFADYYKQKRFFKRLRHITSHWCCTFARPGHIWYDMLHDVIPHTDRFHRTWRTEWRPMPGP